MLRTLKEWDPSFELTQETLPLVYEYTRDYLELGYEAMAAGADRRALETLRHYRDRYPAGSFRPEASALEIEALMKLGRADEARALAERFVAQHRGSLLARRVADVAGLQQR